jgi:hypothetical protein
MGRHLCVHRPCVCVRHWAVSMLGEQFCQKNVSEEPCLWESIYSFAYFDVEVPIVDQGMEIVFVHNFVGYHADGYAYVFISFQRRPEIIVLYVHVHIECHLGGTHAVKDLFCDGEIRCFCCYFTRVLDPITADCHSYSIGIGFVWFVSTHEFDIHWKSSLWDCFVLDEKTCVCALDAAFVSLK